MNDEQIATLRGELEAIRRGLFESWKIYMSWYTWFFGANLIVLGWLFTTSSPPRGSRVLLLALSWSFFNALSIATSFMVRRYTLRAGRKAEELASRISNAQQLTPPIDASWGFPARLGAVAAAFNGFALIGNLMLWAYLPWA